MNEPLRRALWFVGLWLAGLLAVTVMAFVIRLALGI